TSVVWTWGKFTQATSYRNASDPMPEYVISDLDHTHRIVVTGLWQLPFGHGKRWGASAGHAVDTIAGGWQVEGVYQYQTGNALGFGNSILLEDITQVPLPAGQRSLNDWFNTVLFNRVSSQQLADNLVGLSTRFSGVRGPGISNTDLSVFKNFQ